MHYSPPLPSGRDWLGEQTQKGSSSPGSVAVLGEGIKPMAARKKKKAARRRASKPAELIISKARTKAAVKKCNVGGEFYGALDAAVRQLIKEAEARAVGNKRKTLKAVDL